MMKRQEGIPLSETRSSILRHLLGEDLSAINLEEKIGINESAIRRHLDVLEQKGYVTHYFEKAERGRPKKMYEITLTGRRVFPQKTHILFAFLAKEVKEKYGETGLEDLLSEVASDFSDLLVSEKDEISTDERLERLVESLDEFGFYPSLKRKNGEYYIEYRNCVFGSVVNEFDVPLCKMHRKIIKNALSDSRVNQQKSILKGDNFCTHRVSFENG